MWSRRLMIARDAVLFVLGCGLIIQQMASGQPDPTILGVGAGLTGVPAWLHTRGISRTAPTPESSPQDSSEPPQ